MPLSLLPVQCRRPADFTGRAGGQVDCREKEGGENGGTEAQGRPCSISFRQHAFMGRRWCPAPRRGVPQSLEVFARPAAVTRVVHPPAESDSTSSPCTAPPAVQVARLLRGSSWRVYVSVTVGPRRWRWSCQETRWTIIPSLPLRRPQHGTTASSPIWQR